jgi:hypothetical protein
MRRSARRVEACLRGRIPDDPTDRNRGCGHLVAHDLFRFGASGKIMGWGALAFAAFMFFQWLRENEEEKTRERKRLLELERRVKENDERLTSLSKNDRR